MKDNCFTRTLERLVKLRDLTLRDKEIESLMIFMVVGITEWYKSIGIES